MKLYVYDHCPYCVRARMIFGLKNIPFELTILLSDDFETPERLIGKKMAPILQKEDGSYMPESLDIVHYVDNHYGNQPLITNQTTPEIMAIIEEITQVDYKLLCPRYVKIGLPEFATQAAVDYFVTTKTKRTGPFDECLAQTAQLVDRLTPALNKLEKHLESSKSCQDSLSLDDICLFPILRNLTCVKALRFPPNVKSYLESMAKKAQITLYFEYAI